MEATIRKEDDNKVILTLNGRLDTSVTTQTEKEIEPLFEYNNRQIIIDCTQLDYISSSGLRLLMAINQQCTANHCNLYIKGLQEKVLDVFTTTGFVHLFEFI